MEKNKTPEKEIKQKRAGRRQAHFFGEVREGRKEVRCKNTEKKNQDGKTKAGGAWRLRTVLKRGETKRRVKGRVRGKTAKGRKTRNDGISGILRPRYQREIVGKQKKRTKPESHR